MIFKIIFGKTNYMAWGLTVFVGETSDLFFETLDTTG